MLEKGMPADYYTGNPEELPHIDDEHKDTFVKNVNSVLAQVDKLWPMFPSTDKFDDDVDRKHTADSNSISAVQAANPPVNNAFQFYGRYPCRSSQHDEGAEATGGQEAQDATKDATNVIWIRPWDSVFDRKKNGFGTFFAKEVLELCQCDETTIGRILGISMRHIAVKKSEMVHLFAVLFQSIALVSLSVRSSKNHAALHWLPGTRQHASPIPL